MLELAITAGTYALIPAAALAAGDAAAAYRPPGPYMRSATQHFAAGVVFAAAAGELLPDVLHGGSPIGVFLGFVLGTALMLAVKWLTDRWDTNGSRRSAGLIATIGIDLLIDGIVIGIGFAAGAKQGLLLTAALTIEVLFLGLATASNLTRVGASRARVVGVPTALALLLVLGAATGAGLLGGLTGTSMEAVLAFGLAALLYLVTEELLVEAHEEPHSPLITAMFFTGFLLLCLIEMLA
jgi:zinc transporter, ZIP family